MVKDPETGKRISRPNPPSEWNTVPVPKLAIVDHATWDTVQARKRATAGVPARHQRRPRHLVSGLLRCGYCGGGYTIASKNKLQCSASRERGTCSNRFAVPIAAVERRVLDGLKRKLLDPDVIRAALAEYHAERLRLRATEITRDRTIAKRVARLSYEIERLVDRICDGTDTPASNKRLRDLEDEKAQLEAEATAIAATAPVAELHPAAAAAWTALVERLERALAADPLQADEAATQLRGLGEKIVIELPALGADYRLIVHDRLAEILALPGANVAVRTVQVVAGERNPRQFEVCVLV